jgi:hypothetical protein
MKRKSLIPAWVSLAVLLFIFCYWWAAWNYDARTRLVPLVISTPTLLLALFIFIKELKTSSPQGSPSAVEGDVTSLRDLVFILGWFILYFVLIYLVGFLIATPPAMIGFLRYYQKQPWRVTVVATALTWLVTYGMFQIFMGFRLFPGILFGGVLM